MQAQKQKLMHEGRLYYSVPAAARHLGTTSKKLNQILVTEGFDWTNFRDNGPIWISAESIVTFLKRQISQTPLNKAQWTPAPGSMATYTGRTGSTRRNMMVVAEAVGGRFIVEAIGRKGVVVRLTVKRESLIQPQPDFFMATKIELTEKLKELKRALSLIPMSKRKEVLAKGMEISRQRKELVELKRERDQLAASSLMEGKMDSAVQRTTSGDGVAQTSKTPGGQPGSTMA